MPDETRDALARLRTAINADPGRFSGRLLARLFTLEPSLRELFPFSLTKAQEGLHHVVDLVLAATLADGADNQVESPTEVVEVLAQLGRDHRKYGVTAHHYDLARQVLVGEFASVLGPAWTPAVADALEQTATLISGVMSEAAEQATGPAVTQARLTEKYQISREHAVLRLVAETPVAHRPGQFVEVAIPQWPREWRMLSPSTPANATGELEFHVRAIAGGTVSKSIVLESQVGDVWSIAQHHGTLGVRDGKPTTMIAGGTGLAPLRSLLLALCANVDNAPVDLYYGGRYPGELYELPTLQAIAATNPWLRIAAVTEEQTDPWWLNSLGSPADLGFPHLIGTLADAVTHDAANRPGYWDDRTVLVAGSPQMIAATERQLIIAGARASRIQHDAI